MAECASEEYPLGSPLVHIEMCESHRFPIDIICEDCDKFICARCAKTDHRDHDWKTLTTAATERRRGLLEFLKRITEEDLPGIDAKITEQIKQNEHLCDSEIKNIQMHCEEIMGRLTEIKKHHEKTLRENLIKKNDQLNHVKSELDKKKEGIVKKVEFLEKNNSIMSDYSLIDNHRELTKMLSFLEDQMTNCEHSVRFTRNEISDDLLLSLVGRTMDLDDIRVTQKKSFQYGNQIIYSLEAFSEDQCYINELNSKYIEKVNQHGIIESKSNIDPNDMCVTDNGFVYFTDFCNISIRCLTPSGSVFTVICTDPLLPGGICQSVDGGLLVTLRDMNSDPYKLESHSRRLVRHITVNGFFIHEYEYQEEGQVRLFALPGRVTQNSNSDICVLNNTSDTTGDIVIMSSTGHLKSIYRGKNAEKNFAPGDVACDSLCYILVTDRNNKQVHLLSPDGKFLKFLLAENEVNHPYMISLYKSTLWLGYWEGLAKVFNYRI